MPTTPKKQSRRHYTLREGCYCTDFHVWPTNWDKAGASIKKDWQIWYRFYDPAFKDQPKHRYGYLVNMKGMNHMHTLGERRDLTRDLIDQERQKLEEGWNPVRKIFMRPAVAECNDYIIPPSTSLVDALQGAFDRICKRQKTTPEMKINLRSVLKFFKQAAIAAMQAERPMETVKRRHIVMCWEQLPIVKADKWSDNLHNHYRAHMIILFEELYQIETIEVIPMGSIPVKAVEKKRREVLTMEQRKKIDTELRKTNYRLWLVTQIFFHSGARTTELLAVKASDVDLNSGTVRYIVKKGRSGMKRTVYRPIKDIARELWEQALQGAGPDQYLFSEGLVPGDKTIRREQLSRRWRLWVKKPYGITADWYSLKHSNTTEVTELVGNKEAIRLTGHASTKMIDEVYDVRRQDRADDIVRKAGNSFAG